MSCDIMPRNATLPGLPSAGQDRVLGALLTGATVTEAAKAGNVDRATVHRWLSDDPVFIAAYNSYHIEMVEAVRQEVRFLAADAVKALRSVLTDEATPAPLLAAGQLGDRGGLALAGRPQQREIYSARLNLAQVVVACTWA
jgi:hypothetical protein